MSEHLHKLENVLRLLKHYYFRPEPELRWLKNIDMTFDTAIDCGANRGYISHALAKKSKSVVSVEPIPELSVYLKHILPRNCRVINAAISNINGQADLRIPKKQDGNFITALATLSPDNKLTSNYGALDFECITVNTHRLDDLIANDKGNSIDYLKIDVEGHEASLLQGCWSLVEKNSPIIQIELEERHGTNVSAIFQDLSSRDYRPFQVVGKNLKLVTPETFIETQRQYEPGARGYLSDAIFVPVHLLDKVHGLTS